MFLTGFLRIFFSCIFQRNFSEERGFGEVAGIPVFFRFYRNFSPGIPVGSNSCYSGFLRIPEDSGGFLFPPKTKEGSLLSKIWTKIDFFNLSPEQDLTMVSAAPILCWRLLA